MPSSVADPDGSTLTDSVLVGATVSLIIILTTVAVAYYISGMLPAFAENRGFLQLVVAIPLACLLSGSIVSFLGVLSPSHLLWALAPVVLLIVTGALLLDAGMASLPWVLALSGFVAVPWMVGVAAGTLLRDLG